MGLQVMLICKGPAKEEVCFRDVQTLAFHSWKPICFAIQFWGCQQRSTQLWFAQYNGRYFVRPSDLFKNIHDQFHCWLNFAFIMYNVWCICSMNYFGSNPQPYFVLKASKKVWNMDQTRFACYDSSWNINFKIKEICSALASCRK